jgi:exodeoxyribonuclease VII small subunit
MTKARNGAQPDDAYGGDFESSFRKLQEVVRLLSEGNLSLQESLAAFEEGMSLADRCAGMLEQAELRVKEVSERSKRSGSAAAAEMAEPLTIGSAFQDPDLIEVEFERTLIIERGPHEREQLLGEMPPPKSRRGRADSLFDELDPLFDENE